MSKAWLLVGTPENWSVGLEKRVWGFSKGHEGLWRRIEKGDRVFFYSTAPVGGTIGFGRVMDKFTSDESLWPEEKGAKGLWRYRISFEVESLIPKERWARGPCGQKSAGLSIVRAPRALKPEEEARLVDCILSEAREEEKTLTGASHKELINMIQEIGEGLGYKVEREFRDDNFRADVAFFASPREIPFAIWEIKVGGDIYKDLASLKHFFSNYGEGVRLFYVVAKEAEKVKGLEVLEDSYHEMKDHVTLVDPDDLKALHEALSRKGARELLNRLRVA